mmetsp:Transcript_13210/g.40692  ORF Transcript_13210/g.40692 Transcript_13210/m.40692 type:complete len:223 (+) Transcript_13210:363-1031(+)
MASSAAAPAPGAFAIRYPSMAAAAATRHAAENGSVRRTNAVGATLASPVCVARCVRPHRNPPIAPPPTVSSTPIKESSPSPAEPTELSAVPDAIVATIPKDAQDGGSNPSASAAARTKTGVHALIIVCVATDSSSSPALESATSPPTHAPMRSISQRRPSSFDASSPSHFRAWTTSLQRAPHSALFTNAASKTNVAATSAHGYGNADRALLNPSVIDIDKTP